MIVLSLRCLAKQVEVSRNGAASGLGGARPAGDMAPVGRGEPEASLETLELRRDAGGLDELRAEMRSPANLPEVERLLLGVFGATCVDD